MDDEEFDDLLAGVEFVEDWSQESLSTKATNLDFSDHSDEEDRLIAYCDPLSSGVRSGDGIDSRNGHLPASIHEASIHEASNMHPSNPVIVRDDRAKGRTLLDDESDTIVLSKIEDIFKSIANALQDERDEPAITFRSRVARARQPACTSGTPAQSSATTGSTRVSFPGKTADEAWRFTVLVRILELMHEALVNDVVISKRDIYYRDPALFGKQRYVDRYIEDIAFTFGVPRAMLNVTAVAKGLHAGALRLCRRDGQTVDAAIDREGMLVPSMKDILSVDMSTVKWILVLEKEASFRSITASRFWDTIAARGVIITAKGYPDIATRAFLHFLSTASPRNGFRSPPVYGLVDFDPDGVAIFSVYKYGSLALPHENAELRVPQMQWLGLRAWHVKPSGDDLHFNQGLLNLTAGDRKKAINMLDRSKARENNCDRLQLRQALQTMLMLNIKAELQLLDARRDGTLNLLTSELGDV